MTEPATPPTTSADGGSPLPVTVPKPEANPFADWLREAIRKPLELYIRYSNTRRAIRAGEPLFDCSSADLKRNGMFGPWSFNLAETALAAVPTALFLKIITFLWPHETPLPEGTPELTRRVVENQQLVMNTLQPFLVPLALLCMARLLAWGSIYSRDSSSEKRARARYAYLYLDAAYGIVPQFAIAFAVSFAIWLAQRDALTSTSGVLLLLLGLYGSYHLLYVEGSIIPKRLFVLNGYDPRPVHFWTRKKNRPPNPGPWGKYTLSLLFGGWIFGWGLLIAFVVVSSAIGFFLGWIQMQTST